ncbi:MAG: hypothetical protein BWK73_20070 [Thiothrix lacustris]|uniref:Uncharacterized protein n=1 Tax=Thiothrix lacustris TaxID=525917 RepID=A0A1Y1QPD1_9GAMM|nr:MAG: hypothetical protein BWK73_20070 [Thiothrix lacustris]
MARQPNNFTQRQKYLSFIPPNDIAAHMADYTPAGGKTRTVDDLTTFLRAVLTRDLIGWKNSAITPRLDFCRSAAARQIDVCNATAIEQQLGKAGIDIISRKVNDLNSWLVDLIIRAYSDLFVISPTPRPDLSDKMKERAAQYVLATVKQIIEQRGTAAVTAVMQEYQQLGIAVTPHQALAIAEERGITVRPDEEELRDIILEMKSVTRQYETEQAGKAANELSIIIKDYLAHTDSFGQVMQFLHDFCIYPYAILHAGQTRTGKIRTWKKDKLVKERKNLPALRRVSPYDFFWTRDGTTPQNGMAVAERFAMRRFDVEQLKYQSTTLMRFDNDTIDEMLSDFDTRHRDWLVEDERKHEEKMLWSAIPNETVDVFRMFVLVSGFNLEGYAKHLPRKVEAAKQYQVEVYLCSDYILGIAVHDADFERPYFKETYAPIPSEFAGDSMPETLAVVNAAARKSFTHMIRNMAKSTNPTTLVNREMIDFDSLDEDEAILPDTQYDFIAALGSTGRPVELVEFPNYTATLISFADYLEAQADLITGIPRYALGDATNLPSALRSTASLTLMVSNSLKTITAKVFRIGNNVIAPSVNTMVDWVMDNHEDDSVKVDAEVVVQGLEGAITKSLVIDRLKELLQYLAPFVQGGMVSQQTIQSILSRYLLEAGVDGSVTVPQAAQQAMQSQLPTPPAAAGSNLLQA